MCTLHKHTLAVQQPQVAKISIARNPWPLRNSNQILRLTPRPTIILHAMFAVSGWNLVSGPKTQTDESGKKPKQHKKKTAKSASETNAVPLSNKRSFGTATAETPVEPEKTVPKMTKAERDTVVTADNVLALYEKVIEGKAAKRSRDRKKKKEKKDKATQEAAEVEVPIGVVKAEGKKKKRSKPHDEEPSEAATSNADGPPKKKKKAENLPSSTSILSISTPASPAAATTTTTTTTPSLTPLQQKMRAKLSSARFRHINEILYTTPSAASHSLFASQPEMYSEYHIGFRQQVQVWPENPVNVFVRALQDRSRIKFERGHNKKWNSTEKGLLPLPRDREDGICTVADLGCGDAKIAGAINHQKPRGKGKVRVLSYDLQASTPDVTVADIAHLPLEAESVDIAIFCLALMGTNFLEFVEEAFRILRWRGELWIAEIKSRFNRPTSTKGQVIGGKKKKKDEDEDEGESIEPDGKKLDTETFRPFIEALARRGFVLRGQVDEGNKMFVRMEFVKMPERERRMQDDEAEAETGNGETWKAKKKKSKFLQDEVKEDRILKPCVYKLR